MNVAEFVSDDDARDRRLADIRARRGTPERQAKIAAQEASKAQAKKKSQSSSLSGKKTPDNSPSFHGHPWPLWFSMRDAGYEHIIERALERETTTYKELWAAITAALGQDFGNTYFQTGDLLGSIATYAHDKDGVMPTALVMYEGTEEANAGPGFFRLAASMGLLPEGVAPPTGEPWTGMTDAQRSFWEEQRDLVFAHFA